MQTDTISNANFDEVADAVQQVAQQSPKRGKMDFGKFCEHHAYKFDSQSNRACPTHQMARAHFRAYSEDRYFSWSVSEERALSHQSWLRRISAKFGG